MLAPSQITSYRVDSKKLIRFRSFLISQILKSKNWKNVLLSQREISESIERPIFTTVALNVTNVEQNLANKIQFMDLVDLNVG